MLLSYLLLGLALLSIFLNLWQCFAALRFPIHRRNSNPSFSPSLSILRPLKGGDSETEKCLESWFTQESTCEIELLFGVASEDDPVCEMVRRLMRRYPAVTAQLIICNPILGPNAKVSSLCYLARQARHEHIVIADQDVFIEPGFLSELIQPLAGKKIGLVNCFYIQSNPLNFPMRLEAVAVNADFWSQVLQGNSLKPMDFALGAVMATRRKELAKIGGFESLLEYLADDYQLGHRIARSGSRLTLCTLPVECRSREQSGFEVWEHQLRWGRTIRVCQPAPYFFSILSNGTLWPLLAFLVGAASAPKLLGIALLVRLITAKVNYTRLTKDQSLTPLLAPMKDLLQVILWALSFVGNEIVWRGQRFRVNPGGKLTPIA